MGKQTEMQTELFFNTISLSGQALQEARGKAEGQNEKVYSLFVTYGKMTPLEASKIYNENHGFAPETSIRRAITSLTKQGKLVMLDEMKVEKYGMPNHVWRIANGN